MVSHFHLPKPALKPGETKTYSAQQTEAHARIASWPGEDEGFGGLDVTGTLATQGPWPRPGLSV